jgi:hypothetical protein
MERHYRILGWILLILGVLGLFHSASLWLPVRPGLLSAIGDLEREGRTPAPRAKVAPAPPGAPVHAVPDAKAWGRTLWIAKLVAGTILFLWPMMSAAAVVDGWAILGRRRWARMLTLILSVLGISAGAPLGIPVGIYGLWTMFQSEGRLAWDNYAPGRLQAPTP